jgi:hypothetical protein
LNLLKDIEKILKILKKTEQNQAESIGWNLSNVPAGASECARLLAYRFKSYGTALVT